MAGSFRSDLDDWLTGEGQDCPSIPLLVDSFCRFLNDRGFGIRRCNLATDTVHPQMTGLRHVWHSEDVEPTAVNPAVVVKRNFYHIGDAFIDEIFFNAGAQTNPQYLASPLYRAEVEGEIYAAILPPGSDQAFPVFHDLARIGCTAYFARRIDGFARILQKIALATERPGGLTPTQRSNLRIAVRLFTLLLNTLIEHDIKNTLAEVYIGHEPGKRVCKGMIALGRVVSVEAAIWFSDIRGFTTMSEGLSAEQLVTTLNDYYGRVVNAIYDHQGEVLKYIGDAVLAIFPVQSFADSGEACRAALAAAFEARQRLAELNAARSGRGEAPLQDGIALHFGAAQYGNIGVDQRLDFTLIGREVNLASRAESMTKELGPLLCSEAFRQASGLDMQELGCFAAKGLKQPIRIYAPEGSNPCAA